MPKSSETLTYQPPHTLNTKEETFVKQLTPKEQELHALATEMLGSSYFAGKTHAYTKWSNLNTQPPKAK